MQKQIFYVVVAVILATITGNAYAGIHWLPDYLGKNMDRSNDIDGELPTNNGILNCPNGWLKASEIGDKSCILKAAYPGVGNCYGDCICDTDKYPFTEENCKGEYYLSGNKCPGDKDYYSECNSYCNEVNDNLINSTWGCKKEYDNCASKCEVPYTDSCHLVDDISFGYGCEEYYPDCPSKCQVAYENNCHIRQDNESCKCIKYWDDCPSKCEIDTTPRDCVAEGYNLTSCPIGAICEGCTSGCGDSNTYYKFTICSAGYYDKDSFFCNNESELELCTWTLPAQ